MKEIRNYLIAGLAALLPVTVTIWVFSFLVRTLGGIFVPLLTRSALFEHVPLWVAPIMGFILVIVITVLIGALASGLFGKWALGRVDQGLRQLPIVREIYGSARQFTDAVFVERKSLRNTVLVEYPRPGLWAIGFVTTEGRYTLPDGRRAMYVFIPTTPNPTSGWLALIPEADVHETAMTVEQGFKLIVTGGVIAPPTA